MIGAQETGIKKFAVTWGFGEEADLLSYQPDWIAHTIDDIINQL
jgi:phosphoglycolate phosphatase